MAPVHFIGSPASPKGLAPCTTPAAPPALGEARFLPKVEGSLELTRASGDSRLSADGGFLSAWTPDSRVLAFSDAGAVTVWQADNGQLLDLVRCAPGDLSANEVAISPDARWVVVSGLLRDRADAAVTCVVDRSNRSATLLDGAARHLSFSEDGTRLLAEDREIDLAKKLDVEPTTSASPTGPTTSRGMTPDGRYFIRPGTCLATPDASSGTGLGISSGAGARLALVERATGRVLLGARLRHRVVRLAFSPDGAYLAAADARGGVLVLSTRGNRVGSLALQSQHATFLWWTPDAKRLQIDTTRRLRYEVAVSEPPH